jgi:RNA recognition motif-containing protein
MKIYIGNLPFTVDNEALKKIFADYELEEVTIIADKFSGRSKGFGFVTIADDEAAKKAIEEMNGKEIEGRELKVSEAKPMEERPKRDFQKRSFGGSSGGGRSFGGGNTRRRF